MHRLRLEGETCHADSRVIIVLLGSTLERQRFAGIPAQAQAKLRHGGGWDGTGHAGPLARREAAGDRVAAVNLQRPLAGFARNVAQVRVISKRPAFCGRPIRSSPPSGRVQQPQDSGHSQPSPIRNTSPLVSVGWMTVASTLVMVT